MKRRFLAWLLCAVMLFNNALPVFATEGEGDQIIIENTDTTTETTSESTAETEATTTASTAATEPTSETTEPETEAKKEEITSSESENTSASEETSSETSSTAASSENTSETTTEAADGEECTCGAAADENGNITHELGCTQNPIIPCGKCNEYFAENGSCACCSECGAAPSESHTDDCPNKPIEKCAYCDVELKEGATHEYTCHSYCPSETNHHITCSEVQAPKCCEDYNIIGVGQIEHGINCPTRCTCTKDPEAECPLHPKCEECGQVKHTNDCPLYTCPECNGAKVEGEIVHSKNCPTLIKCEICKTTQVDENGEPVHIKGFSCACTCKTDDYFHAENCPNYVKPVDAEVYTTDENNGAHIKIDNDVINVEKYDGKTIYVLKSDVAQNIYFTHGTLFGIGVAYSIDNEVYGDLDDSDDNTWLGSGNAIVTVAANAPSNTQIKLTANMGIFGKQYVTIEVIDELILPPSTSVTLTDGNTVSVEGVPEGADLKVEPISTEKSTVVDSIADNLFAVDHSIAYGGVLSLNYDIKIMQGEDEWQPENGESVYVTIEVPDFHLDYRTYLQGIHILDTVDAINSAVESGNAISQTELGLAEKFPAETAAALAAGFPENTIVYTIMLPETGDMWVENGNLVINATSFSINNITGFNVDNSEYMSEIEDAGLKLDKTAHVDYETGEGYVELSSYVKGEIKNTPTDVVMVIDHSGSMWTAVDPGNPVPFNNLDEEKGTHEGYYVGFKNAKVEGNYGKTIGNTACLIRYYNGNWQKSKYVSSIVYDNDGAFVGFINTVYNSDRNWVDITDEDQSNHIFAVSISGALYDALNTFMAEMENAVNCRVAICTFAGRPLDTVDGLYEEEKKSSSDLDSSRDFSGSGIFIDGILTWDGTSQKLSMDSNNNDDNLDDYEKAFEDPSTEEGQRILYETISEINTDYGNTPTALGLLYARRLFNEGGRSGSNKVAVVFTDGLPSPSTLQARGGSDHCTHDDKEFEGSIVASLNVNKLPDDAEAKKAAYEYAGGSYVNEVLINDCPYCDPVQLARKITSGTNKDKYQLYYKNESTYVDQAESLKKFNKATVYSIGPTAGRAGVDVLANIATSSDHYFNAAGDNIAQVFRDIAGLIVSASQEANSGSKLTDIVSDSFKIPDNANTNSIKVYTEDYTGTSGGKDNFNNRQAFTGATVELDKASKTIKVSGFDYGSEENAVGMTGTQAKGKRLIVQVPIVKEPDFLGGDHVETNGKASGVYNNTKMIGQFPMAYANVQVQSITPSFTDTKIYLSQEAEIPHLMNAGKYKVNGTEYTINGENNAYAKIVYTVTDSNSNSMKYTIPEKTHIGELPDFKDDANWDLVSGKKFPVSEAIENDRTYTIKCEVISVYDETGENKSEKTDPATISVYKPVITFQDSKINLGQTANYTDNLKLNDVQANGGYGTNVVWKHGDDVAKIADMGNAPVLQYTYDIEAAAFEKDTPVKVTSVTAVAPATNSHHVVDDTMQLLDKAQFYRAACDFVRCNYAGGAVVIPSPVEEDSEWINFIVHLNTFNLLIDKIADDVELDPNQTFIFRVTNETGNFSMDVVVKGDGEVLIKDLQVLATDYQVEELTDWSWRYEIADDDTRTKTIDFDNFRIDENGTIRVPFKNTRENPYWMDGNTWCQNVWKPENKIEAKPNDNVIVTGN